MRSRTQKQLYPNLEVMKVSVVDQKGKDTGRQVDLSKDVFGVDPHEHALYLDVKQYLAHQQLNTQTAREHMTGNCVRTCDTRLTCDGKSPEDM